MVDLIDRAIAENPNVLLTEGNLIAPGYNADLDELRSIATEGHRWIAEYQAQEGARTGEQPRCGLDMGGPLAVGKRGDVLAGEDAPVALA